ncbi:hypothetical protein BDZ94DRAFT_1233470 [Collybia nuda]|uniref:Uncharacterized protein n=1 Tax=Collybia nuda TaxID=64659 RepID=A0A9P6CI47_9AGAR|nr:hypothetical protein BDZ94DRAFT_1233470 [Collybia nuda]
MSATMTSTVFLSEHSLRTSSIMIPGASTDVEGESRVVRFDDECVLIPDRSKRPKMVSKSYSLPLWKKKQSHTSDSDTEVASPSLGPSSSVEDARVVLKVPIPRLARFISKSTRSPSRGRSPSASPPTPKPLSPCLVHRSPSSSPSTPAKAMRRSSLPLTTHHKRKDDTALTIPLRACCPDCVPITEESLKEGEQWQEKFSRGARRRRSASLDNNDSFLSSSPTALRQSRGFSAVTVNPSAPAVVISCANPRYDKASTFSITVDEVDKRRKSLESEDDARRLRQPHNSSPRNSLAFHSPNAPFSSAPHTLVYRPHEKEASTSSTSSSISASSELGSVDYPPRRPKSSPIQEEDEDQLFPLPSPRRTPNNSPSPSINASPSASPAPSTKVSPAPSPHGSTSCLAPPAPSGLSVSRENLPQTSPAGEGIIARSLSRKSSFPESEFAAQQTSTMPSPIPVHRIDTKLSEQGASSTGTNGLTKPKPSPLVISEANTPPTNTSKSFTRENPAITGDTKPTPPMQIPTTSSSHRPNPSSSPVMSTSPKSPSRSPTSPGKQRRPSFSLPYLKDTLKGAGSDILKGVSSMGGGGAVGSV